MDTVVVGFDGLNPDLAERFARENDLENFQRFLEEGSFGTLESSYPPVSGPAWTTFATGKNPGKHGIYDFVRRRENSYSDQPINSSYRKSPAFWNLLSERDHSVGIINVPSTYPPDDVNGFMISGMLSPGPDSNFTHPKKLKNELRDDYEISPSKLYSPGREQVFLDELLDVTEKQFKQTLDLMRTKDPDLLSVVYDFTDIIHHFFWGDLDNPNSNFEHVIPETYERADRMLGRIMDEAGADTNVIMVSDHGGGSLEGFAQLNLWLHREGYLHFKSSVVTRVRKLLWKWGWTAENVYRLMSALNLQDMAAGQSRETRDKTLRNLFLSWDDIDWDRTRAYARGHVGQIYINKKGREPEGFVETKQAKKLRDEIRSKLMEWEHPEKGTEVVSDTYTPEEIFEGPELEDAPDLLVFMENLNLIDYPGVLGSNKLFAPHIKHYSGGHRMQGTIAGLGPDFTRNTEVNANIKDVAPTLLYLFGEPVPRDMDGRILEEVLDEDVLDESPPEFCDPDDYHSGESSDRGLSSKEEEEVQDRLRNMGYLG